MGFFSPTQYLGNTVANIGNSLSLPELGISEWISGQPTPPTPQAKITTHVLNNATSGGGQATTSGGSSTPVLGAGTTTPGQTGNGTYYYTGGGTSAPAYDPNTVAQFDSAISAIDNAIGQVTPQHSIANQNIRDEYDAAGNRLQSGYNSAENQYKTSSTGNMQSLRTNKNNILDQQSQGLRGLLRTLGMYGATGSDADLASNAVADQATQQRSGAGTVFAQNQRGLQTNWGQFQNDYEGKKKELNDWKQKQLQSAEQQAQRTKQDLLTRLAELRGQREATLGGSFSGAAKPYLDQANALSSSITQLGRFKPTFDGTTPVYQAPSLDSYQMGQGPQIQAGGQPQTQTPALQALLGLGQREDEDKVY